MEHGFGHIEALLVFPHETAPFGHPAERSQSGPATGQHLEAGLMVARRTTSKTKSR